MAYIDNGQAERRTKIVAWRVGSEKNALPPGKFHAGVDLRFGPQLIEGRVTVIIGGIGSSGLQYNSSALRKPHRPKKNH
ncbi:MAG: hypothetical protein KBC38_02615 [Candidatus Pacebacteria bacterium]|nr:hypothetical protein [Candidatus Paceibacterota bacterium]MBP9840351.1 hypothetical protein [Candidatus Paceibacterota bacterium]